MADLLLLRNFDGSNFSRRESLLVARRVLTTFIVRIFVSRKGYLIEIVLSRGQLSERNRLIETLILDFEHDLSFVAIFQFLNLKVFISKIR